ncbi:MAG: hypothetical protein MPN21_03290 [Thermoanaerobaculia bacterium]|nr:hypothetical protein [Thermoanaerobaculia bacterium]
MSRRSFRFAAVILTLLALFWQPAAVAQGFFVRPLAEPLADQPFEIFFAGVWILYTVPSTPDPEVRVDGEHIDVKIVAGVPPILPPASYYTFGAQVEGLPAGDYTVRLFTDDGSMPTLSYPVTVRQPRLDVEVLDSHRLEGESARLAIRGLTRCPAWPEGPVVDGDIIYLPEALDCVADPPQPFTRIFTTPPLEAGEYTVYAVEADPEGSYSPDDAIGFGSLKVDPRPALWDGRFGVDVAWHDFEGGAGSGRPVAAPSEQSALFWFFGPTNWELMVKVLDGCEINDHYWVLTAASTNVAYDLAIEDTVGRSEWSFANPLGTKSPAQVDIEAFPCGGEAAPPSEPSGSPRETVQETSSGFPWLGPRVFEPAFPDDTRPTTLHLVGTWPTGEKPTPAVDSIHVDAESQTIEVALSGPVPNCGIIPPCFPGPDYAFSVDLGILAAGDWDLEVVYASSDGPVPISDSRFFVWSGYEIVAPDHPVTDLEPVDLLVRGVASCPSVEVESIGDGEIDLRVEMCPIGVPPSPEEFEIPVSLDLDPGTYRVQLRPPFSEDVAFETQIDVVGVPVPLGPSGRYLASVTWTDFEDRQGLGLPATLPSEDSALFWFFGPRNWELMLKVLDACDLNGHVWVFGAATTTVAYELRIVDSVTGAEWIYENPLGEASDAITDVEAFVCD